MERYAERMGDRKKKKQEGKIKIIMAKDTTK
jgi:hypothetical protein